MSISFTSDFFPFSTLLPIAETCMKYISEISCLWFWGWIRTLGSLAGDKTWKRNLVDLGPQIPFCWVILSLLCPLLKALGFLKVSFLTQFHISVAACCLCPFRSRDSNSSSITSPGFLQHSCGYPTTHTPIYSPVLDKLSSNYPNLSIASVSCWVADSSNYHQ